MRRLYKDVRQFYTVYHMRWTYGHRTVGISVLANQRDDRRYIAYKLRDARKALFYMLRDEGLI